VLGALSEIRCLVLEFCTPGLISHEHIQENEVVKLDDDGVVLLPRYTLSGV
jgi:hypothetical protein